MAPRVNDLTFELDDYPVRIREELEYHKRQRHTWEDAWAAAIFMHPPRIAWAELMPYLKEVMREAYETLSRTNGHR